MEFKSQVLLLVTHFFSAVSSYPHRLVLDPETDFVLRWEFNDVNITFEACVASHGWYGVGFSQNGMMRNADIIMMWMKDGKAHLLDMHGTGNETPELDYENNVDLVIGYENETHTCTMFRRTLTTCDEDDYNIRESTIRVLWAMSYSDVTLDIPHEFDAHRRRGSRSIRLLNNRIEKEPEEDEDTKTFVIQGNNVLLPPTHTYYHCRIVHLKNFDGNKHHVIRVDPVIDPGNEKFVHHMILYLCVGVHHTEYADGYGEACYSNMPSDYVDCMTPIGGWAVGGTTFKYPENVGLPIELTEKHHNLYFMIEVHYDNVEGVNRVFDNSGLRIHYTPNLRPYDAGVLLAGHTVTPLQIIPANSENWLTQGHCTAECINELFRDTSSDEAHVFATHLHSHLAGTRMNFRLIRDGKEQRPLQVDDNYDVNYQEIQLLPHEATIKRGDRLIVECTYDTFDRDYITFGGLSSENEMCLGFLWYYPKSSLQTCTSAPTAGGLYHSLGVDNSLLTNIDPYEPWISNVGMMALRNVITLDRDPYLREELNRRIMNTSVTYDCKTDLGFVMSETEVDNVFEKYITRDNCIAPSSKFSVFSLIQVTLAFSLVLIFSIVVSYFCFQFFRSRFLI